MIRMAIVSAVFVAGALGSFTVASSAGAAGQAAATVTAADAAPFVGAWTLQLEGPNGPATFGLTIKVEKEKVVGEITSDVTAPQAIADITKADKSLVLRYAFDYQGNPVDAVVKLTPVADGKTTAQIDFAGGAYVMTGSATKKEKSIP